jgi:hypothetical protein
MTHNKKYFMFFYSAFCERYPPSQKVYADLMRSLHHLMMNLYEALNNANRDSTGGSAMTQEHFATLMRKVDGVVIG